MAAIHNVLVKCGNCTLHFAPALQIPDTETFEQFAAKVTPMECPLCSRSVSVSKANMSYTVLDSEA
jgi:hypothetical protein